MERLPHAQSDAAFEDRYLEFVANAYGRIEVFGFDLLSKQQHHWPLRHLYTDPMTFGDAGTPTETTAGTALSGRRRTLVRGAAGSGKTTLLWHMAVSAAQGQRSASDHLHEHIPFVLPVGRLRVHRGLPRPAEFLDAARSVIAAEQPVGWAERVLAAGRGLLLIDGVDEVEEAKRTEIRSWLGDLLTAYPLCSYVVTTRTQAVPESWLSEWEFAALELGPMDPDGVQGLITRWYALNSAGMGDPAERAASESRRDALLAAVVERPDLREMASNPLMCSLLCVVNERGGLLPRAHGELYGAVLSMMLGRRDEARAISAHGITSLGGEAQTRLLQHLAYWLQRNGRTETSLDRAHNLIAGLLRSMPGLAAERSPETLLAYLCERSGLLQTSAPGHVGFAHRSFQAYLAAKEAVEQGDFGLLVDKADDPSWQDVVLMAFAHARRRESTELFASLLDRAERDRASRVRLHVLAAMALKYVHVVDPGIREQVEYRLAQLIPPRNRAEEDALVEVGQLALELMPGPGNLDPDGPEARMIVRTAQRIGGPAAHELVRRFVEARRLRAARVPRPAARPAEESVRVESWATASHQGDAGARVLEIAGSDPPSDLDRLAHTVHHVVWRGAAPPYTVLARLPLLRTLVIADSPALTDLDGLPALPRLRTLRIAGCPALRDLTALARTGVVFLDVSPNPGAAALGALAGATRLRVLGFPWPDGEFDLEGLRRGLPGVVLVPRSGVRA